MRFKFWRFFAFMEFMDFAIRKVFWHIRKHVSTGVIPRLKPATVTEQINARKIGHRTW